VKNKNGVKFGLLYKFLISVLLVAALPLVGLWAANLYFHVEIEKQIESELKQSAGILAASVNGWSEMNLRVLQQSAKLPDIESFDESKQRSVLKTIVSSYEWVYSVFIVGADGYIAARGDDKPTVKADGSKEYYRGDREYFKEVMSGRLIAQQVLLSGRLDVPALILCVPINAEAMNQKQTPYGALCMAMLLEKVSDAVADLKIGSTGYAMLLDDKNRIIAHGNKNLVAEKLQNFTGSSLLDAATIDKQSVYERDGMEKIVFSVVTNLGWRLIVERDFNDAYGQLIKSKRNFLLFLISTIILSILISMVVAKILVDPIKRLTVIADAMSKGQFQNKLVESSRNDEIGALAKAIERMGVSIGLAVKKLRQRRSGG
jgi:methyl-accepting chemotaxis protein